MRVCGRLVALSISAMLLLHPCADGASVTPVHLRTSSMATDREFRKARSWIASAANATQVRTISMIHWFRSEVLQPEEHVDHFIIPFRTMLFSALVWLILSSLVAYFYKTHKASLPKIVLSDKSNPRDEFDNGRFGCFNDWNTCLMSFFCSGIRWADTMSMANFSGFWVAFATFHSLAALSFLLPAMGFNFALLCICVYYRQALRAKLEIPRASGVALVHGFLYYCCCPCCAIAQEARVVEQAWEVSPKLVESTDAPKTEAFPAGRI